MKKLGRIASLLFIGMLFITSCNEEIEPAQINHAVIERNSELFDLIESMLEYGDRPIEDKVCIDFVYPFKLFIYDADSMPTGSVILHGDDEFTQFLGSLSPTQTISISYPIQTTLPDGSIFSVINDEQLKVALESCSREDIISYCNGAFRNTITCVWEMSYDENLDNEFAESIFKANSDGSISLHHHNTDYVGTWVFLYVDNILHLNIHLSGNNYVTQRWNYDYVVDSFDSSMLKISSPGGTRTFVKQCSDTATVYAIGDTGPSGGLVAYDKGEYTNGWRYIEIATTDLLIEEEWGCDQSSVTASRYDDIGTGYQNTVANIQFHDRLTNYYTNPVICSADNNGTLSAKTALGQVLTNSNWFIPSIEELKAIRTNLTPLSLGNFDAGLYWTSSEFDSSKAKCLNFVDGETENIIKNSTGVKTRIIRYF
ncbi:hypothetical protein [Flavobacterium wongokense]|uniref:hypothetical protein n=1 Tax=Flavobacterium wongokense TaxID=2910674 RepID=UPI001F300152|nr:hypothetical protein [Flavobacterium sp. WG47]MCF6130947.1 hypothetical protein [Flavobacterium sp. WG47]